MTRPIPVDGDATDGTTREPPRTARGARTRAALVAAARRVFERDGYLEARLADITTEAGTAAGSFYTYFTGKEEIFAAVLEEVKEEMLHPDLRDVSRTEDPVAVIAAANRAYLESYQRNAQLMRLLEQVSTIDDRFADVRRQRARAFTARNARSVRALQERGLADPELDADLAAAALSSMVSRTAYNAFVVGAERDVERLAHTLTRLWVNALGIPERLRAAGPHP
ncbi:TetR/AcrR family transcriptional regulator [Mumia sp. zg.B53]|uniref:TetR/AcrR family transcriptional regulator n=1 Tax=unclassified Mumia TaxID=2621872 RepID=UPI001C6EA340|nr:MULTISPECIES: TetR/AcrR family transcriptional regulator [unclassified Mumia]MBW9204711.1 TetR/AcrR family transcriptional regulator [Mumia sp. zg.B17]MBW9209284.1 TetR/AcrR family transcriptional regulator [Mumia sp. zg.B21]MBW9213893.1 TetR/AcrR family transcriptional regulator [Mumia sp. zg.B53]